MARYIVTAVVDFVVEVDDNAPHLVREAESIVEAHLDDDDLVYAYTAFPRAEPFEQTLA